MNNSFSNLFTDKFQIEKSFSSRQKNQKSRNLFQIHKIMRDLQIFFKSIKKMKIRKSFQDHKTMSNQQIFLKFPNKLEFGEIFSSLQIYRCDS